MIINVSDLKLDVSGNINYFKGVLDLKIIDVYMMEEKIFVLVGKVF